MVELKYKNWNETPINVYLKIRELLRSEDENEEKTVGIISLLTDLDIDEVMEYCERECGYVFVPKMRTKNIPDGISPDFIAAYLEVLKDDVERKRADFHKWLSDYLHSLSQDEARDFMYSHLNATNVEMDDVNYEVGIPQAIIDMAKNNN